MKTLLTRLLRFVLQVRPAARRQASPPRRRLTDSAPTLATVPASAAVIAVDLDPKRSIAIGRDAFNIKLVYAIGEQRFILSFPDTNMGFIQAAIAVGGWTDLGCGFDMRGYREVIQAINGLLDEACEGKGIDGTGNQGVIHL